LRRPDFAEEKKREDLPLAVRDVEVTVAGSTGVAVRCEKCERTFYHELLCKAFGRANLVPLADQNDARRTALSRAKQKLRELLKTHRLAARASG
jgi:hypothetical protein